MKSGFAFVNEINLEEQFLEVKIKRKILIPGFKL